MSKPAAAPWSVRLRLHDVQRNPRTLDLQPDAAQRAAIGRVLDLVDLPLFQAEVQVRPWLDGAEVSARWRAEVVQTCGVSLDDFATALAGEFTVKAVPADSPAATAGEADVAVDPDAEDPPDVLERDEIDLGAYLVEHLGLEIDPFPRKPGAEFEAPPAEEPPSPFAVLQALKRTPGESS